METARIEPVDAGAASSTALSVPLRPMRRPALVRFGDERQFELGGPNTGWRCLS